MKTIYQRNKKYFNMEMNKAVQRLQWHFTEDKRFNPNQNDIDAFNTIAKYYNETNKQQLEQNQLFAKLYIHVYGILLKHYKSTVFDNRARKQVHKILQKPLTQLIDDFTQVLNDSEFYELMNDAGIDLSTQLTKSSEEKQKEVSILQKKIKEPKNALKYFGNVWDIETVTINIESEINNALNQYR